MPPLVAPKSTQWHVRRLAEAQRLAEEFPQLQEPYRTVLFVADRSDPETRAKMLQHFLTLPQVADELKEKARGMLAGASYLSDQAQAEAVRKARQDFQRGHPSPDKAAMNLLSAARRAPASQATELVRELLAKKDLPDMVEKSAIYYSRHLDHVGQQLEYRLRSLDGRVFRDDKLRGKVVVIYFWAVPRRGNSQSFMATDVAGFAAQMKRLALPDVVAIAYNLNNDPRAVRNFADECKLELPVVCDGQGLQGAFVRKLSIQTFPVAWVIDRQGRVREVQAENRLPETLQALLAEPSL
jgi:peroxiredoxin